MAYRVRLLLMAAVAVFATLPATGQTIKVGYADPEVIITYMSQYQQVQQQLASEYQQSQQALQAMAADFEERVDRYQKQQALLSPERRTERENELAQLQNELQQSAANEDQKLSTRQEELMAPLLEEVQAAIDAIAAEKGLDIVMRSPALLFVNEDTIVNINIDIARRLGIEIDDEAAGN